MKDPLRAIDDLVVLNDNDDFKHLFVNTLQTLGATDACAGPVWRGTYDASGTSWHLANLQIQAVSELSDVLTADAAPNFSWFLTLPSLRELDRPTLQEFVLVYAICLQKPGAEDKVYFGSAFSLWHGAHPRVKSYCGPLMSQMSLYVRKALDMGYEMVHVSAFSVVELEYFHREPFAHSCILGHEAWSTYHFWGIYQGSGPDDVERPHYPRHLCPVDIGDLNYGGICSHSVLAAPLSHERGRRAELDRKEKTCRGVQGKASYVGPETTSAASHTQ